MCVHAHFVSYGIFASEGVSVCVRACVRVRASTCACVYIYIQRAIEERGEGRGGGGVARQ